MTADLFAHLQAEAWAEGTACETTDPAIFFTGSTEAVAMGLCHRCPVEVACRDYALDAATHGENLAGVWGGTTRRGRRRYARIMQAVA